MSKQVRAFGLLFLGMLVTLALGLAASGPASASPTLEQASSVAAQTCDTSPTRNGSASRSIVLPGQTVTFTGTGFLSGEEVSFWFTLPNGDVFGTARPLCCAGPGGIVILDDIGFTDLAYRNEGRWALTFQGSRSNHIAVIYFCLFRQLQPTATPAPPSPTPVPPTPTVPAATPTVAVATPTAVVETPTVLPTVPVATITPQPPPPTEPPPTVPLPPPPPLEPTATMEPAIPPGFPTVEPGVIPGMPTTGEPGGSGMGLLFALMAALALVGTGLVARFRLSRRAR